MLQMPEITSGFFWAHDKGPRFVLISHSFVKDNAQSHSANRTMKWRTVIYLLDLKNEQSQINSIL